MVRIIFIHTPPLLDVFHFKSIDVATPSLKTLMFKKKPKQTKFQFVSVRTKIFVCLFCGHPSFYHRWAYSPISVISEIGLSSCRTFRYYLLVTCRLVLQGPSGPLAEHRLDQVMARRPFSMAEVVSAASEGSPVAFCTPL
jgi:hypothetical protein